MEQSSWWRSVTAHDQSIATSGRAMLLQDSSQCLSFIAREESEMRHYNAEHLHLINPIAE